MTNVPSPVQEPSVKMSVSLQHVFADDDEDDDDDEEEDDDDDERERGNIYKEEGGRMRARKKWKVEW